MFEAIGFVLTPLTWGFSVMARLLQQSGAIVIYIPLFFIGVVLRLIVRPFIGEAHKDISNATRKNAREFIDKHSGD